MQLYNSPTAQELTVEANACSLEYVYLSERGLSDKFPMVWDYRNAKGSARGVVRQMGVIDLTLPMVTAIVTTNRSDRSDRTVSLRLRASGLCGYLR